MPKESIPDPPSAAFVSQVTRCQRNLHAFIVTLVRNPVDADDVLQEANLVLWRKANEYDPARPFLPWAMRIAQFQAMAWLKTRKRSRLVFDEDLVVILATEASENAEEYDPRRRALADCLRKLPPLHRKLVARRYEPGGCVNDLAAERGTSPKALSEMLRRIRRRLLQCILRTMPSATSL
jgi:RNA polymerase sigma-70 factor (ECF subfamily)